MNAAFTASREALEDDEEDIQNMCADVNHLAALFTLRLLQEKEKKSLECQSKEMINLKEIESLESRCSAVQLLKEKIQLDEDIKSKVEKVSRTLEKHLSKA